MLYLSIYVVYIYLSFERLEDRRSTLVYYIITVGRPFITEYRIPGCGPVVAGGGRGARRGQCLGRGAVPHHSGGDGSNGRPRGGAEGQRQAGGVAISVGGGVGGGADRTADGRGSHLWH